MGAFRERGVTAVPASANACAVASPVPELVPVTRAKWPLINHEADSWSLSLVVAGRVVMLSTINRRFFCSAACGRMLGGSTLGGGIYYIARAGAALCLWRMRRLSVAITTDFGVLDQCCGTTIRRALRQTIRHTTFVFSSFIRPPCTVIPEK